MKYKNNYGYKPVLRFICSLLMTSSLYPSEGLVRVEPIWFDPQVNVDAVKKLLTETKGAGIDARNSFGQTGLMYAINMGSFGNFGRFVGGTDTKPGLVEELIKYGADVNAKSEQSPREEDHSFANTPLHYANIIVNPRDAVPLIDYLIRAGGDVNAQNNLKETPLMWASQASLPENLQALFKEMITNLADVNMQNNIGNTYLHLLIRNKDILGVQYMMEHFGSMFDLNLKNREGWTPLEYAINTLQPESERAIKAFRPLGLGDNIRVRDEFGRSPLMLAILRNDLAFAERQIMHDAKLNDTDTTKYKNYPIHFAVIRQYTVEPFVNLLLKNKADPNAKNAFGDTPLHYLVKYNIRSHERNEIAKLLIENGANPKIANKKGETAIDLALKLDAAFAEKLESLFRNAGKTKKSNTSKVAPAESSTKSLAAKNNDASSAEANSANQQTKENVTKSNDTTPTKPSGTSSEVRPLVVP